MINKLFEVRGKRKDNGEWVSGYYFTTPLTAEYNIDPVNGSYFDSGLSFRRHVISNEDGVVFEVIPETLEKSNSKVDGLTFGDAIEALKKSKKVARRGWNGKNMFLFLLPAGIIPKTSIHDSKLKEILENNGSNSFHALASIRMKTADDKILTGWLASQTDMLSEDWIILE